MEREFSPRPGERAQKEELSMSRRKFVEIMAKLVASAAIWPAGLALTSCGTNLGPKLQFVPKEENQTLEEQPTGKDIIRGHLVQPETKKVVEVRTGMELLDDLNLNRKGVYVVYGRPDGWGSLGLTESAKESWELFDQRKAGVVELIKDEKVVPSVRYNKDGTSSAIHKDLAWGVINPVYDPRGGQGEIEYIKKALELARGSQRLVAVNFDTLEIGWQVVGQLEAELPRELLPRLAVSLDVEHFSGGGKTDAGQINEFSAWFAAKHKKWAGEAKVPGLVFIYTFGNPTEQITNLDQLKQYYLKEKTLAVMLFDGFGTDKEKLVSMAELVNHLPNTKEFPALVGVMEFRLRWGEIYDKSWLTEIFKTLYGAPVSFFATQ